MKDNNETSLPADSLRNKQSHTVGSRASKPRDQSGYQSTDDPLIHLSDVPDECRRRGMRAMHKATVYRWRSRGVNGRRLQVIQIGRNLYTRWSWILAMRIPQDPTVLEEGTALRNAVRYLDREIGEDQ